MICFVNKVDFQCIIILKHNFFTGNISMLLKDKMIEILRAIEDFLSVYQ